MELDARLLLLKVYIEIAEWRLLRGFLTTFERYVRRKKKLAYHAPLYLNIIHFAQRILLLRSGKRRSPPCAPARMPKSASVRHR